MKNQKAPKERKLSLWSLGRTNAGEPKWAIGKLGPRVILTCTRKDAQTILKALRVTGLMEYPWDE